MYDIIIIGGGISALYFCYLAIRENPSIKILILEKKSRLGGRIYTETYKNLNFEMGAGRFRKDHDLLNSLINDFSLTNKIIKNGNEKINIVNYKIIPDIGLKPKKLLEKAFSNMDMKSLYLYSPNQIIKQNLTPKQSEFILNTSSYIGEYYLQNAEDFYHKSIKDFYSGESYYSLKDGLSQIIDELSQYLNLLVEIKLNATCKKITKLKNVFQVETNTNRYKSRNVIITPSPSQAKSIMGIIQQKKFKDIFNQITPLPLYRIYAIYPKKKGRYWFSDIPRVVTNSPIQTIIPINKEKGLIMISYSDYQRATSLSNQNELEQYVQSILKKLFPDIDIPKPNFMSGYFWKSGTNYWKPGFCSRRNSDLTHQPIKNIFLMGEAYSKNQAWMEGALENTQEIFKLINNRQLGRGIIIPPNNIKRKINQQELSKHNKYNDAWIALEGYVYDVTSFISQHPGGSAIFKGLGKEYTNQWDKISSHRMNRNRINEILRNRVIGKYI